MAGTKEGGIKTAITNKQRYGEDFYKKAGYKGGSAPYTGKKGFAAHPEKAKKAGKKGGAASVRGKNPEKVITIKGYGEIKASFLYTGNLNYRGKYPLTFIRTVANAVGVEPSEDALKPYEIEISDTNGRKKKPNTEEGFSIKLQKISEDTPGSIKEEKSRIAHILARIKGEE